MAYPALFRHLFGDNPVRPFKFRKELIPLDVDAVENFRKSLIGCLIPTTMATLPSCLGIPDGSLFLFDDYPELKEKFDADGFNGMLLEATATSEEKDAWRGKWIKHPQGLGLYSPRLSGLFLRNAGGDEGVTGAYLAAGAPEIYGTLENVMVGVDWKGMGALSAQREGVSQTYGNTTSPALRVTLSAAGGNNLYGASDTIMPASVNTLISIYLGRASDI